MASFRASESTLASGVLEGDFKAGLEEDLGVEVAEVKFFGPEFKISLRVWDSPVL